ADGQSETRQYLTRVLSEHYEIEVADASTTLTLIRERAPDLVIAEISKRVLRDFDIFCDFCRDAWRKVPVILCSAPSDKHSCVNVLESRAGGGYLITPFSEAQFLALVRSELRVGQVRHESLECLQLSEERFRTLKTMLTPGLWVKAPNGEIISELASWWEKLTGQTREQYTGFGYLDVVHPIDKPHVLKTEEHALRNKTGYQIDFRVRQRNGSYSYVRSQAAPVCDADGNVREWVGTIIDIDEQRRMQEALRASEERYRSL